MEVLGISLFDLVVLGVFSLAALIGLVIGFTRGSLFVLSWFVAIVTTLYFFPVGYDIASGILEQTWAINLTASLIPFLLVMTVMSIISHRISRLISQGKHSDLDRVFGLMAGLVAGAAVLSVAYLPLDSYYTDKVRPDWVLNAKSRPLIEKMANWTRAKLPAEILDNSVNTAETGTGPNTRPEELGNPRAGSIQ